MRGTLKADFAGTYAEALEFAQAHGFKAAKGLVHGPNGPIISFPFRNETEFRNGLELFDKYGWDRDSIIVTTIKRGPGSLRA